MAKHKKKAKTANARAQAAVKAVAPEAINAEEKEEEAKAPERAYTLRKLTDGDLLLLLRILRKLGLKSFKGAFKQLSDGKSVKEVGVDVVLDMADIMIEALDSENAAADIYALYADLSGIAADEIRKMEFGTLPLMIYDSFQEAKNAAFFRVLARLL